MSGFLNKNQLAELSKLVGSQRWNGQYLEMKKAIVNAADGAVPERK